MRRQLKLYSFHPHIIYEPVETLIEILSVNGYGVRKNTQSVKVRDFVISWKPALSVEMIQTQFPYTIYYPSGAVGEATETDICQLVEEIQGVDYSVKRKVSEGIIQHNQVEELLNDTKMVLLPKCENLRVYISRRKKVKFYQAGKHEVQYCDTAITMEPVSGSVDIIDCFPELKEALSKLDNDLNFIVEGWLYHPNYNPKAFLKTIVQREEGVFSRRGQDSPKLVLSDIHLYGVEDYSQLKFKARRAILEHFYSLLDTKSVWLGKVLYEKDKKDYFSRHLGKAFKFVFVDTRRTLADQHILPIFKSYCHFHAVVCEVKFGDKPLAQSITFGFYVENMDTVIAYMELKLDNFSGIDKHKLLIKTNASFWKNRVVKLRGYVTPQFEFINIKVLKYWGIEYINDYRVCTIERFKRESVEERRG